jgi:tRNA(Ile)-lysidine synthase
MTELTERVAETLVHRGMLEGRRRVGVAVSGGADSVALLGLLAELAPRFSLSLSVVHLNHCLRGAASDADEQFVASLAARHLLPFHVARVDVAAAAKTDNLEQAARRARSRFFLSLIHQNLLDCIATAHTLSDQAETVLYRILRGAGPTGLAGILPVTREGLIRPLIDIPRAGLIAWLLARGQTWRDDETNRDTRLARNHLRLEILPTLRGHFNPRLDEALGGLAEIARAEEDYWASITPSYQPRRGALVLPAAELSVGHTAVLRRRTRAALAAVKGDLRGLEFAHIERVIALASAHQGSGRLQLPGLDVFRSFDWIRIAPLGAGYGIDRLVSAPAGVPSTVAFPDGSQIELSLCRASPSPVCDKVKAKLDWPKVLALQELEGKRLAWRNWRPGDRYRNVGSVAEENLKSKFEHARVPLWKRRAWPVLTCGERILWARRFGPALDLAASPASSPLLLIRDLQGEDDES